MNNESNLYSIDRLMEFGMGVAVAQQMVKTMNETMTGMKVPGAGTPATPSGTATPAGTANPPLAAPPARIYYIVFEGKQAGPFSEAEMTRLIVEKRLTKETLVWHPALPEWKKAADLPDILRLVALTPPAMP